MTHRSDNLSDNYSDESSVDHRLPLSGVEEHFIHNEIHNVDNNMNGDINSENDERNALLSQHNNTINQKIRTHPETEDVLYFEDLVRNDSLLHRFQEVFYTITLSYLLFSIFFITSILITTIYLGFVYDTFHNIMSHQYMPFITFGFYIAVSCVILWLRRDAVIKIVNYILHFTMLLSIILFLTSVSLFFDTMFFVLVSASITLSLLMLLITSRYESCNIMNSGPYNISLVSSCVSLIFFAIPNITYKLALITTLLMSAWIAWTIMVYFIFHLHKIMVGKHIRYSYSVYDGLFCSTNLFIEWGNYIIVLLQNIQNVEN